MACELCGNKEVSISAEIEGVVLRVCAPCGRFGKVLSKPLQQTIMKRDAQQRTSVVEVIETMMDDYAIKIKQAREKRNMNQEEFARFLNERESTLQKIETGKQLPDIETAKKLEKQLQIKLVEKITLDSTTRSQKNMGSSLTIGDLLQCK